jgi:hypothetical protein
MISAVGAAAGLGRFEVYYMRRAPLSLVCGAARLAEMLEQSAFYSQRLQRTSANV